MSSKLRSTGGGGWESLAAQFKQFCPWFGLFLLGRRQVGSVIVDGVSLRFDGYVSFCVVRGLDTDGLHRVVAFGKGETVREALKNVSLAIAKSDWRRDKFAKDFLVP